MNQPSPDQSTALVLTHFAVAAVGFVGMSVVFLFERSLIHGIFLDPMLVGTAHLFTLAWISTTMCGALLQFVPVLSGRPLFSRTAAHVAFVLWTAGLAVFPALFIAGRVDLVFIPAVFLYAGVTLFAVQIVLSILAAPKPPVELIVIVSAVFWFFVTATGGFLMAFHLTHPVLPVDFLTFMRWHIHAGTTGWFLLTLVGAGAKLFPMFFLSHAVSSRPVIAAAVLINAGLILGTILTLAAPDLHWISKILVGCGFASFMYFVWRSFKTRMKKKVGVQMGQAVVGIMVMGAAWLVSWIDPAAVTFLLGAGGIALVVTGLTFKIVPFIEWMRLQKRGSSVLPAHLSPDRLLAVQVAVFCGSVSVLLAGGLLRQPAVFFAGKVLFFAAACLFLAGLVYVLLKERVAWKLEQSTKK